MVDKRKEGKLKISYRKGQAGKFAKAERWKHNELSRHYLVRNGERKTQLVVINSVQGVTILGSEGEISCRLVDIFKRHTRKNFIDLCQDTVECL